MLTCGLCWIGAAQASPPPARASRTLNVSDEAHLRLIHSSGETLQEEGQATGALPGTVHVRFRIGANVSGTFTIYPHGGGSISGEGSAKLHSTGTYASFGGTTSITHGTSRYAHIHGHGTFYGIFDRRSQSLIIQTRGQLSY